MKKHRRTIKCLLAALVFLLAAIFVGCSAARRTDPITDVSDLDGRRVGVGIACDTDYALTGRKDLTLVRYDELANILLALQYDKVDVMALDALLWRFTASSHKGLRAVEPAFATSGYTVYFRSEVSELRDEFNEFLSRYRQSEAFRDFEARLGAFDGEHYNGPDIELTGTGRVLRVAVDAAGFPRSFAEADGHTPSGYDLEALKLFANEKNYRLSFVISGYDDMIYGLQAGNYDIAAGFLSDLRDADSLSSYLCKSDSLYEVPLYFIEKTQDDIELIEH